MMREHSSIEPTIRHFSSAQRRRRDAVIAPIDVQAKATFLMRSQHYSWFVLLRLVGMALHWGGLGLVIVSAISGISLRFALDALGGFLLADGITLVCWHTCTLRSFAPADQRASSMLSWCGSVGCLGIICVVYPGSWVLHAAGVAVISGCSVWLGVRALTRIRSGRDTFEAARSA